jgi:DNA-binding transcriptional MerR regulator
MLFSYTYENESNYKMFTKESLACRFIIQILKLKGFV